VINFRFHLVSLVAVFLALAVGIVMGYGVLGQPTVDTLRHRIDTVEANAEARRHENDALRSEIEQLNDVAGATSSFVVTDRLRDVHVLVVAVRGLDGDTMTNTVELARRGGADAPGIIWLEEKWGLGSGDDRRALANAIDTSATKRSTLRERGLRALANRLASGPGLGADLLRVLTDGGFVSYERVGDGGNRALTELGGVGTNVLFMVGTDGGVPAKQLLPAFARASVAVGVPLVTSELYRQEDNGPGRGTLVGLVRSDENLAKQVSTVDDLDRPSGPVVALLALADLGRGVIGHYGLSEGASAPAPAWWQP
jgi:hypothetical protein